jgi:hypothetical protein
MNKPKKSLIECEMVSHTPPGSSTSPYNLPETLMHMRRMEAKEWVQRYRTKARADGAASAQAWWAKVIADIERIRGLDAALELRNLMNEERSK